MGRKKREKKRLENALEMEEEVMAISPENDDDDWSDDEMFEQNDERETNIDNKRHIHPEGEPSSKKSKVDPTPKNIKLPSAEELNSLRETEALHHSNMFRLQMEELLKELTLKEKYKVKIEMWKTQFTLFTKSLETSRQFELKNKEWVCEYDMKIPLFCHSTWPTLSGVFQFFPPEQIILVGSFASQMATTHSSVVDLALVLPKEFMQHNDLVNCRWLVRRALYLCWLGKGLKQNEDLVSDVSWTYHCGSHLRPVLQITPNGNLGKKLKINLFPVPPEGYFKVSHISPVRNNVTVPWYFSREKQEGVTLIPTPSYNWACGVDVVMLQQNRFILENLNLSNWIEGAKLFNLWFTQRYFNQGEGCISNHLTTLLVIYLIKNRKIILQMSPYQVFRTILLYLVESDWKTRGPSLATKIKSSDRNEIPLTVEDFHSFYPFVFIDHTGYLNLVTPSFYQTYLELQLEAKKALEILELSPSFSFEPLFIQKMEFYLNYDQILKINLDNDLVSTIFSDKVIDTEGALLDSVGDKRLKVFKEIISILTKALSDRLDFMSMFRKANPVWGLEESPPANKNSLTLGFLLNPVAAVSLLTKGPSADTQEAKDFRDFWGEICSLRRFQDSTFHEAVLWGETGDPIGDRRLIVGTVSKFILEKQCKIPANKISYVAPQLENFLRMPNYRFEMKYGTGEEVNTMAILAFDRLSKKLRSLNLPIQVTTVQSSSDVLKHSVVFPPLSKAAIKKEIGGMNYLLVKESSKGCPHFRYAIDVQLFLEISGKWPDDLLAIQAMKTEFHCKMAELLKSDGFTVIVFPTFMQILWEGYIFNVRICYRKEIYLLRLVDKSSSSHREEYVEEETEESIQLEKDIEIFPRFASYINSLQSEFQSFSGSVRLIRRWLSSQLLMPHLPPVVLELLVAHLFMNPAPFKAPNTPHVALLRFMHLMAVTDWKTTPIIVNLRNHLSALDQSEILKLFNTKRSHYPALFICSPCELRPITDSSNNEELRKKFKLLSCWSRQSPSTTILARIKSVATSALACFTKSMYSKKIDFSILFRPSLDDYDVVIYLNHVELARRSESLYFTKPIEIKPYKHMEGERIPPAMFDPIQFYLDELRVAYDHFALFFHDEHGGDVIGVVWKPQALTPKGARISTMQGHRLSGENQVSSIETYIEDFKIIGKGIVKEMEIKKDA